MKSTELRDLTLQELNYKLNEAKENLFNLRFQLSIGQLENPLKIRYLRRDIARIKTVIKEMKQKGSK